MIAEIRAGTYTLNLKERVRKHIYSNSEGEMHWSTDVYHAPEFTYSNVHLLPKTGHLWILSGGSCGCSVVLFSRYINTLTLSLTCGLENLLNAQKMEFNIISEEMTLQGFELEISCSDTNLNLGRKILLYLLDDIILNFPSPIN